MRITIALNAATEHQGSGTLSCDYGLISEAVTPGFDYSDMRLATATEMQSTYPENWEYIKHLVKDEQ